VVFCCVSLVGFGGGKTNGEGVAMNEGGTDDSSSDAFEAGYRAYVQAMRDFWANVDVDEVVSQAQQHGPFHPMGTFFFAHPMGTFHAHPMGTFHAHPVPSGTFGTYGTYGTYGCSAGPVEDDQT
jgi:hypothetical protein